MSSCLSTCEYRAKRRFDFFDFDTAGVDITDMFDALGVVDRETGVPLTLFDLEEDDLGVFLDYLQIKKQVDVEMDAKLLEVQKKNRGFWV